MSWRDSYLKASFRDVPFAVRAHEAEVGRRVALHEFPQRDKAYAEDLGRKPRAMVLDAFVLGDDYMVARNQLLRAFEAPGPGKLVHPYLGELQVSITRCRLAESTEAAGAARFQIEFVETGLAEWPTIERTGEVEVGRGVVRVSMAARTSFEAGFAVGRKPQFVADGAAGVLTQALDGYTAAVGKVRGVASAVAALQKDVTAARNSITTLIFTPASAAQAAAGNLERLVRSVATTPRDSLALARVFYRFGFDLAPVDATTGSRTVQARNQAETVQLVRATAVAEGARAAARVAFESFQEAAAARDELMNAIDELMLAATSDELYDSLRALGAAVVRDIATRGANLARLVQWTPQRTLPALAIAQGLYADATRADELLARNRVRHPLFVPGARPLEVLSDAA